MNILTECFIIFVLILLSFGKYIFLIEKLICITSPLYSLFSGILANENSIEYIAKSVSQASPVLNDFFEFSV